MYIYDNIAQNFS